MMKFLKKREVCVMVSYSASHIDRLVLAKKFPSPVTLGQARRAWVEQEVKDWMQKRMDERDSR
jgi:predicted DNA-binding transcriptional regulator AlpA